MVSSGFSARLIKSYLSRWTRWWVGTTGTWEHDDLLKRFIDVCRDEQAAAIAVSLLACKNSTSVNTSTSAPIPVKDFVADV